MRIQRSTYRGALLGLACGDAMGYTVDSRTWPEIQPIFISKILLRF